MISNKFNTLYDKIISEQNNNSDLKDQLLSKLKEKYDIKLKQLVDEDLTLAEKWLTEFRKDLSIYKGGGDDQQTAEQRLQTFDQIIQTIKNKDYTNIDQLIDSVSNYTTSFKKMFEFYPSLTDLNRIGLQYSIVSQLLFWSMRYDAHRTLDLNSLREQTLSLVEKYKKLEKWISTQVSLTKNKLYANNPNSEVTNFKDRLGNQIKIGDKIAIALYGGLHLATVTKATGVTLSFITNKYSKNSHIKGEDTPYQVLVINDLQLPEQTIDDMAISL